MKHRTIEEALTLYKEILNVTTVIDVGTQRCTDFLINVFPESHHYLFEPLTIFNDGIAEYYKNISHTLISDAVSDTVGPCLLEPWSIPGIGVSGSHIFLSMTRTDIGSSSNIIVNTTTLDKYFSDIDLSNFNSILKIDVDCVECEIIKGGSTIIPRIGLMIVECNVGSLSNIVNMAEQLDFSIWDIVSRCYYRGQFTQCDILFINNKLKNTNIKFRPYEQTNTHEIEECCHEQ